MDLATLHVTVIIIQRILLLVFLFMVGCGPGFVVGLLLANRLIGRGLPLRMEIHQANLSRAAEHNKQWNPDNPKWQK